VLKKLGQPSEKKYKRVAIKWNASGSWEAGGKKKIKSEEGEGEG